MQQIVQSCGVPIHTDTNKESEINRNNKIHKNTDSHAPFFSSCTTFTQLAWKFAGTVKLFVNKLEGSL